jgi:hypothetical protein
MRDPIGRFLAMLNGTSYTCGGKEVRDQDSKNELSHSAILSQTQLLLHNLLFLLLLLKKWRGRQPIVHIKSNFHSHT